MKTWFKFHSSARESCKVQSLPPEIFKTWVNLLCLAAEIGYGGEPAVLPRRLDTLAYKLRLEESVLKKHLTRLVDDGLLQQTGDGLTPHDWQEWQQPDTSAERMRRYRAKNSTISKSNKCDVTNVVGDVTAVTKSNECDVTSDAGCDVCSVTPLRHVAEENSLEFSYTQNGSETGAHAVAPGGAPHSLERPKRPNPVWTVEKLLAHYPDPAIKPPAELLWWARTGYGDWSAVPDRLQQKERQSLSDWWFAQRSARLVPNAPIPDPSGSARA
jgi:hypothetical protein